MLSSKGPQQAVSVHNTLSCTEKDMDMLPAGKIALQMPYLGFFRKDSGLVMVKDQGGDPRQNRGAAPAALVQHYQCRSPILGKGICRICAVYVIALGQEVCLNVAGSQSRQGPMQSSACMQYNIL